MLAKNAKYLLAQFFIEIAHGEEAIEMNKQLLARIEEFEPYSTFCKLDVLQKGYLTYQDFGVFMQNNQCTTSSGEEPASANLDLWKLHGKITYSLYQLWFHSYSYQSLILPACNQELRQDVLLRKPLLRSPVESVSPAVITALVRLFEKQGEVEVVLSDIREKLRLEYCVPYRLFEEIDVNNSLFIDADNLSKFVEGWGESLTKAGVDAVMRRFDKDGDGKLSYMEFLPAILYCNTGTTHVEYSMIQSNSVILEERVLSVIHEESKQPPQLQTEPVEEYATPKKLPSEPPTAYVSAYQRTSTTVPSSTGKLARSTFAQQQPVSPKRLFKGLLPNIKDVLRRQIEMDKAVEELRRELWQTEDFTVEKVLDLFNAREHGMSIRKVEDILGGKLSHTRVTLLFRQYDQNGDGLLNAEEIEGMLRPQTGSVLRSRLSLAAGTVLLIDNDSLQRLSSETEGLLKRLLVALVDREEELERTRATLKAKGFSAALAFEELETDTSDKLDIRGVLN